MGPQNMLMPIGWLYGKIADVRNALYAVTTAVSMVPATSSTATSMMPR